MQSARVTRGSAQCGASHAARTLSPPYMVVMRRVAHPIRSITADRSSANPSRRKRHEEDAAHSSSRRPVVLGACASKAAGTRGCTGRAREGMAPGLGRHLLVRLRPGVQVQLASPRSPGSARCGKEMAGGHVVFTRGQHRAGLHLRPRVHAARSTRRTTPSAAAASRSRGSTSRAPASTSATAAVRAAATRSPTSPAPASCGMQLHQGEVSGPSPGVWYRRDRVPATRSRRRLEGGRR